MKKIILNGTSCEIWMNLSNAERLSAIKWYEFHELDIEACLEENQRARVDYYDDYIFLILHFPKYNQLTKRYLVNEFNIFVSENYFLALSSQRTNHIEKFIQKYEKIENEKIDPNDENAFKISSWYILYEVIQAMLEKVFTMLWHIRKDIKQIEEKIYRKEDESLAHTILLKKRNLVVLKHMIQPQVVVIKTLWFKQNPLFDEEMKNYLEDLQDKIERIVNDINLIQEDISSIEEYFKTTLDMKTNFVIKILTIFSSFLLPLTVLTSFYWMNIDLPFQQSPFLVYLLICMSLIIMVSLFWYFKKTGKF